MRRLTSGRLKSRLNVDRELTLCVFESIQGSDIRPIDRNGFLSVDVAAASHAPATRVNSDRTYMSRSVSSMHVGNEGHEGDGPCVKLRVVQ